MVVWAVIHHSHICMVSIKWVDQGRVRVQDRKVCRLATRLHNSRSNILKDLTRLARNTHPAVTRPLNRLQINQPPPIVCPRVAVLNIPVDQCQIILVPVVHMRSIHPIKIGFHHHHKVDPEVAAHQAVPVLRVWAIMYKAKEHLHPAAHHSHLEVAHRAHSTI